jgi:hypothetical protein
MTIATDSVDSELVELPRRWDIRLIRRFMLTFGPASSVFDYLTFGVLLVVRRILRQESSHGANDPPGRAEDSGGNRPQHGSG